MSERRPVRILLIDAAADNRELYAKALSGSLMITKTLRIPKL